MERLRDRKKGAVSKTPYRRFGFYGCCNKVVCLENTSVRPPSHVWIDCPACGHEHDAKPFWRKPVSGPLDADRVGLPVQSHAESVLSGGHVE